MSNLKEHYNCDTKKEGLPSRRGIPRGNKENEYSHTRAVQIPKIERSMDQVPGAVDSKTYHSQLDSTFSHLFTISSDDSDSNLADLLQVIPADVEPDGKTGANFVIISSKSKDYSLSKYCPTSGGTTPKSANSKRKGGFFQKARDDDPSSPFEQIMPMEERRD